MAHLHRRLKCPSCQRTTNAILDRTISRKERGFKVVLEHSWRCASCGRAFTTSATIQDKFGVSTGFCSSVPSTSRHSTSKRFIVPFS